MTRQYGLGRLHLPDGRDHRFLAAPPSSAAAGITKKLHYTTHVWDQGETPHCTAFAADGWLVTSPVRNTKNIPRTTDLYKLSQKLDGIDGENYDGTTIRGTMSALRQLGYVSEYRWVFTAQNMLDYILTTAPMVIGVTWWGGFFAPDKNGFIAISGSQAGGHAVLVVGADRDRKCPDGSRGAFRAINSWSRSWGDNGRFWIPFAVMDALMRDYGEAATATEVLKPLS